MGLRDHKQLKIVRGIPPAPGDTASYELPMFSIDLLDEGSGISLDVVNGWDPNIPSLKGNGIWADSPITAGRMLIAGVNSNVTETMKLIISSQVGQVYSAKFAALQRIIQDARSFWDSYHQLSPIYLEWWAADAPGPQYSSIYTIDMDVTFDDSVDTQAAITLKIEREQGWRPVRPGGSAKEWTHWTRRVKPTTNNLYIYNSPAGNDHLVSATLKNCTERNGSTATVITNKHFIDIPASLIPGDLPALVSLWITGETPTFANSVFVARWTGKNSLDTILSSFTLPAGGAFSDIADTAGGPDTGGVESIRSQTTFATSTALVSRMTFSPTLSKTNTAMYTGSFALFLRARLSAAGTVGIQARLGMSGNRIVVGEEKLLTDVGSGGTGNTTQWGFMYLGQFRLPFYDASVGSGALGRGIDGSEGFDVSIYAERLSGTPTLYMSDLIFMPIDEGLSQITAFSILPTSDTNYLYDNSSYLAHGRSGDYGIIVGANSATIATKVDTVEIAGQGLTLEPNVNNRLFFLQIDNINKRAKANMNFSVGINIIPQWSGIRDA